MRRFAVPFLIVVAVVLLCVAGVFNLRSRRAEMQQKRDAQITLNKDAPQTLPGGDLHMKGKPAPGFTLNRVEGGKLSLADLKGKPTVVNFWGTWCGPCQLEMPWFQEFSGKYKDKNLQILGISDDADQPKEDILKLTHKLGVTYTLLYPNADVVKAYGGIDVYPETFYIDRNGVVVAETAGAPSKDEMEANIRKAIGGGQ